MAEERFEETDQGYYVQVGDVREWRYKDQAPPQRQPVTSASASSVVHPKRKAAPKKATRKVKKK